MTKLSLTESQLAALDELVELAKTTEQKIRDFSEKSQKIAEKWQQKAEAKRILAQK